ncbi:MAG: SusD/RagB family nutrient-binding outer membrane lipoprotein [Bacteroidales bacterium]|nr:SusD/RagB family nutrient-binding outer membrane lipoprotein [Bacteroidales bacterium]
MKANKLFIALSLLAVVGLTSCRDEFAELNQKPSAVTTEEPSFMLTAAEAAFETNDYTFWFYNQPHFAVWSQMGTKGIFNEDSYRMDTGVNRQTAYINMLSYRNKINAFIENNDRPECKAYAAMCGVLAIYGAIYAIDINGDIQYTEAAQYRDGGPLTPKYDSVEELYDLFVTELDGYIKDFQDDTQVVVGKQDIIYGGNLTKWAKLANSLKLKVAVRLYNNNPSKAGQIAQGVLSNSAGYIDSMEDAFIFHKADASTGGDLAYQTGNSLSGWMSGSSEKVIDFMVNGRDPRVRFFYTKNGFNSLIIKEFIAEGKKDDLPPFVLDNINLDVAGGEFESYKLGEPWCRYHGTPLVWEMSDEHNAMKGVYFETGDRYQLAVGDAIKSYSLFSGMNEEMVRGRVDFSLPTIPGGPVKQDTEDVPWWGLYMGAGEVNLYLAELRQLGAISNGTAQGYYERGVELSVKEWDYVAGKNKIPYYGTTYDYDPLEVSIELKDGEIATMLATDAVKWDGSMEKIYLQELMNFTMMPDEFFVTARRSGYPKVGSALLPFTEFKSFARTAIPRRFEFTEPLPTDIMHDIRLANLQAQGFTTGSNQSGNGHNTTSVLNTERLWQDKNAPQWGEGK